MELGGNAPPKIFLELAVAFKIDCRLNNDIATWLGAQEIKNCGPLTLRQARNALRCMHLGRISVLITDLWGFPLGRMICAMISWRINAPVFNFRDFREQKWEFLKWALR